MVGRPQRCCKICGNGRGVSNTFGIRSIIVKTYMKRFYAGVLAMLLSAVSLAAVNINTATEEELKALPGIGPSKAAAIVAYRQHNGQFKSVDDLKNVKGIGEGVLAKLRDEATVNGGARKKTDKAVPAIKGK